jgi:hypothetical protein
MTTSKTTGLPNQAEYTDRKSLVPSVIILSILPDRQLSPGFDLAEAQALCSADDAKNLFKFEHAVHGNYEHVKKASAVVQVWPYSDADGKTRLLVIVGQPFANSAGDCVGLSGTSVRQNNGELVATITGRVNRHLFIKLQ